MEPVVETTAGKIKGSRDGGACSFLGVPYGADTSGGNRFRPPAPPEPWAGVRDTAYFGPAAPQLDPVSEPGTPWHDWLWLIHPEFGTPRGASSSEDCLVLNLWTPSVDDSRRPVLVWLHGGGFSVGAGHDEQVRGDHLALQRDVVVVTVNHRLGVLGFLDLEDVLGQEYADSGVAGMLDVVAALEWVRDNIAQFGGDPSNVTVAGHSGGGGKVAALFAMPAAGGLFHRAVVQSGAVACRQQSRDVATEVTSALLGELGLAAGAAKQVLDVEMEALLAAQQAISVPEGINIAPVAGVGALPDHAINCLGAERSADVPLLIGTTLDDSALSLLGDPDFGKMTERGARARLRVMFGAQGSDIMRRYQAYWPGLSPERLLVRIMTEYRFRADAVEFAERRCRDARAPVFMYTFTHETSALDGRIGSCHNVELPFVFANVDRIPHAGQALDRHQVEDNASALWSSFMCDGVPSHPSLPAWPRYDPQRRSTVLIDAELRVVDHPWGAGLREVAAFSPVWLAGAPGGNAV